MERLTHKRVGQSLVGGYWSPNRKQELIDELADYENIGYSADVLKNMLAEYEEMKQGNQIFLQDPKNPPKTGDDVILVMQRKGIRKLTVGCFRSGSWFKLGVAAYEQIMGLDEKVVGWFRMAFKEE